MTIDISFIIPAYNGEAFLAKSIQSALDQSDVSVEIIVLDDGSATPPDHIIESFSDNRSQITYKRFDLNRGVSKMCQIGIELAIGSFISILDADDYIDKNRSKTLLDIALLSSADIIGDNLIEEGVDGENQNLFFRWSRRQFNNGFTYISLEDFMRSGYRSDINPSLGYAQPLIKRSTLRSSGVSFDDTIKVTEDYFFIADLLAQGASMVMCDYAGYHYIRHAQSLSYRIAPERLNEVMKAETKFKSRHALIWTSDLEAAYQWRLAILEDMQFNEQLLKHIREKAFAQAVAQIWSAPGKLPSVARKFYEVLVKRLKDVITIGARPRQ